MECRKVAVIGAGVSGILAIKSLKEVSIEPVCFERSDQVGGIWCYRKDDYSYESATVMSTTSINNSKELGAISDFPYPDDAPNYLKHKEMFEFLVHTCEALDIKRHITFNKEVIKVERAADYEHSGQWNVTVKDRESKETTKYTFDAVVICTGVNGPPVMPSYPGMSRFRGRIIHTQRLRTFESFKGENVVVVGTGCSAIDAAVEISNVSNQVYWSVRTPSWIMSRRGLFGLPLDYTVMRRYITLLQDIFPTSWISRLFEHIYFEDEANPKFYGIDPKYPLLCRDPIISDHIYPKLMNGAVKLRKDIKEVVEDGVIFKGDTQITKANTLIMASGYKTVFPFLEDGIFRDDGKGKILLYKCVFPPHLQHPTIGFVGIFLPFGPGLPLMDLQSRWIAQVFTGGRSLPGQKAMMQEIETRFRMNDKRYSPSDKMSLRIDIVPTMDSVASEIGAKPNFWKMAITDPRLFLACVWGPAVPYQYRLQGPHKWEGARKAIFTVSQRVKAPLKQPGVRVSSWDLKANHHLCTFILMVVAMIFLLIHTNDSLVNALMPLLVAVHLLCSRCVAGKRFMYYCSLMCALFWIWFPSVLPEVVIVQIIWALLFN